MCSWPQFDNDDVLMYSKNNLEWWRRDDAKLGLCVYYLEFSMFYTETVEVSSQQHSLCIRAFKKMLIIPKMTSGILFSIFYFRISNACEPHGMTMIIFVKMPGTRSWDVLTLAWQTNAKIVHRRNQEEEKMKLKDQTKVEIFFKEN